MAWPRSQQYRPACVSAILSLAILSLALNCSAQQPKVLAPHKPIAPKVPDSKVKRLPGTLRSMVGGYWRIDPSSKATIYLKNGLETSPLAVTPILYLSNGVRYEMAPVMLEPEGTATVSINDSLERKGIASYAELSGYVEVQYTWAWDPLCVSVSSFDPIHSLIFTYGLQPSVIPDLPTPMRKPKVMGGRNAVEGMWWKPEANVTCFVALSNISGQPADATVQVSDSDGKTIEEESAHISPHGTKTVSLRELQWAAAGSAGGLRILYTGSPENLLINQWRFGGRSKRVFRHAAISHFGSWDGFYSDRS